MIASLKRREMSQTAAKKTPSFGARAAWSTLLVMGILVVAVVLAAPSTALAVDGSIAGTVTDSDGSPLQGISVSLRNWEVGGWDSAGYAETTADGSYMISGLRADTYSVGFDDYSGAYAKEYYSDVGDFYSATGVVVTAGEARSGIDASLEPAGHITGTVTDSAGVPLNGRQVCAFRQNVEGGWDQYGWGYTEWDGNGRYDIGGLSTGTYRVEFTSDYSDTYAKEYYPGSGDLFSATDVVVTAGETRPGIDAALDPLDTSRARSPTAAAAGFRAFRLMSIARTRTGVGITATGAGSLKGMAATTSAASVRASTGSRPSMTLPRFTLLSTSQTQLPSAPRPTY